MIFHNIKTITIGEFVELISFSELNLIKRFKIPLPNNLMVKARNKLISDYNELTNNDEVSSEIRNNVHKLKSLTQINIHYRIMLDMLRLTAMYGNKKAKKLLIETYKYIYKKEPKTAEDYEKIDKDINLKIKRYKQRYSNDNDENNEKLDIEKLIINIEIVLAPVNIRDKKLHSLPKYIEMASQKIKTNGRD